MKTNTIKSFLTITLAMFIISVAIYFFLIPSGVITGSVTGLAMVLAKITSLSISTLTFVINALLLILGIILIGKEFGAKTIYASLLLPLFLAVFERIYPNNISLTQNAVFDMATYILILAFGQTILFRVNASSGGTDIIAKIVNSAEPQFALLQCLYKLICEILAPYILNFFIGEVFLYLIFYSQHKVGLAHARGSVNNKGVVGVCGVGRHRV